jgi:hypothetical protein
VNTRSMIMVCLTLTLTVLSPCQAGQTITAAVDEDIIIDYQLFVGERDPLTITHFSGPGARRDVIEIILLQQALHLGGFSPKIVLRPEKSYLRILRLIQDGQVALSAALMWKSDLKKHEDSLLISPALVHEGEFIAGLYTHQSNKKALNAKALEDLQQLSAASNSHWKSDIATLHQLGIKKIYYATYWPQMVRMVVAKRADITLAPFQSNLEMKVLVDDLELVPIQGIKVSLPGSRHWPISKKYPDSAVIKAALTRGIAILKAKNTIQRAYEESGFFHPAVKNWTLINPPDSSSSSN